QQDNIARLPFLPCHIFRISNIRRNCVPRKIVLYSMFDMFNFELYYSPKEVAERMVNSLITLDSKDDHKRRSDLECLVNRGRAFFLLPRWIEGWKRENTQKGI